MNKTKDKKKMIPGGVLDLVFDQPLMITESKLAQIIAALENYNLGGDGVKLSGTWEENGTSHDTEYGGKIAVIPVRGSLTNRTYGMSALSGLTSYTQIRENIQVALDDPSIKSIILDLESNGGSVSGAFDLVDWIYSIRSIKPIVAFANEYAYSAAYAIASAADSIYLPRTGTLGSIGVIMQHKDISGMNESLGIKYTTLTAGKYKDDYTPNAPLSKHAISQAQRMLDTDYKLFVDTVIHNRPNLTSDVITGFGASIFHGQDAVDIGLADGIKSFEEVVNTMSKDIDMKAMETQIEELKAEIEGLKASSKSDISKAVESAIQLERERCLEIVKTCNGVSMPDLITSSISDGITVDMLNRGIVGRMRDESKSPGSPAEAHIQSNIGALAPESIKGNEVDIMKKAADRAFGARA